MCPLTYINFPNTITKIMDGAFYNCNFENITFPDELTYIGREAFNRCFFLKSIVLKDKISVIEYGAFYYTELDCVFYLGDKQPSYVDRSAFSKFFYVMVPESYDDGLFGEWNVIKGEYLDECVSYIPTTSISQSLSSDYNTNSQYMSNSDGNQGSDTDSTGTIAAVVVVVVVVVIGAAVGAFFIIRRRKQKMANDAQNVFEDEPQLEEIEEKEGNGKGDEPNNEVDDLLV